MTFITFFSNIIEIKLGDDMLLKRDNENIENEVLSLLKNKQNNWFMILNLSNQIKDEKIFLEYNVSSFLKWVKYFCKKNRIQESCYWSRLKASKILNNYINNEKETLAIYTKINEQKIAFASFILIDKITQDLDEQHKLIDILLNSFININDLRYVSKKYKNFEDALIKFNLIATLKKCGKRSKKEIFAKKNFIFRVLYDFKINGKCISIIIIENISKFSEQEIVIHTIHFDSAEDNEAYGDFSWIINNTAKLSQEYGELVVTSTTFEIKKIAIRREFDKEVYKHLFFYLL